MANGVISVKQVKVSNNKAVCLTVQQNNDLCCEVWFEHAHYDFLIF